MLTAVSRDEVCSVNLTKSFNTNELVAVNIMARNSNSSKNHGRDIRLSDISYKFGIGHDLLI